MGVLSGIDNITGWALLQKNGPAIEKAYAADSSQGSDIAYFKSVAATITTPDALLKNYRALSFVATAYGLGSQVDQTAILKKLMTQDPTATTSLAQQLSDNNYRTFANAMSNWSPPPFSTQSGIDAAISGYQQHAFDTAIGTDSVPLQEADYFTNNAKGLTTIYQLMSDPALLNVVTTALGIPSSFGNLSFDQQVSILKPRVDMTQFSTADGIAKFVSKYLTMDQLNQVTSGTAASSPLLALFGSGNTNKPQGLTLSAQMFGSGNTLNLIA
jgi:hypothetical protein